MTREPLRGYDIGDRRRSGAIRDHALWDSGEVVGVEGDDSGSSALQRLLDQIEPIQSRVLSILGDCDAAIYWSATADNSQVGFILEASTISRLSSFGIPLIGTFWPGYQS
ncbi:hypothetical protein QT381_15430 [Galbitalea sp. SE-J8]|uniref:hypothetical protein n=1 Tax=Galbitalea sp. SE-J8 TaxID=3054952 RepID=UPI00259C6F32|nr:hypothetical protein [Galbitalea sp. SE-J8]MDM4764391.1 hypothetical protein [Galbitalea sp. SE-J8]